MRQKGVFCLRSWLLNINFKHFDIFRWSITRRWIPLLFWFYLQCFIFSISVFIILLLLNSFNIGNLFSLIWMLFFSFSSLNRCSFNKIKKKKFLWLIFLYTFPASESNQKSIVLFPESLIFTLFIQDKYR